MHKGYEPLPSTCGRALIIGEPDHRVDRVKQHLAEYFSRIDLLTDLGQLNSLTADNFTVIVVTDTVGDGLNQDFFVNLRSLHPRARLLCLFDRISRQTEKAMRSAGLLFLGSYEHFDDCYGSVLERAFGPQKANQQQPDQISTQPLKAPGTAKRVKEKRPDQRFSSYLNSRFDDRIRG